MNTNPSDSIHFPIGEDPARAAEYKDAKVVLVGDTNEDGELSVSERFSFFKGVWRSTPKPVRRTIVGVLGSTLVLLGGALVVLPGPFTLPLVLAGLAILASEFAWAERLLVQGRKQIGRVTSTVRRKVRHR